MKITLEMYNTRYSIDTDRDDYGAGELKEIFSRIMVVAGYSPSIIELNDGEGAFQYVAEDEIVVKKEKA